VDIEAYNRKTISDDLIGKATIPLSQFFVAKTPVTGYRIARDHGKKVAGTINISSVWEDDNKDEINKEIQTHDVIAQLQSQVIFLNTVIAQRMSDHDMEVKAFEAHMRETEEKYKAHDLKVAELSGALAAVKESEKKWFDMYTKTNQKLTELEKKHGEVNPTSIVEETWECNRYMVFKGWLSPYLPADRTLWSDANGNQERTFAQVKLPDGWAWQGEWAIDANRLVDREGWEYNTDFLLSSGWKNHNQKVDTVRRRRWIRTRVKKT